MTDGDTVTGRSRPVRAFAAFLAMASAFVLDRLSKNWALTELSDGTVIPLLPTVELRLAFNPGVAFSLGAEVGPLLAVGVGVLLLALLGWIAIQVHRGAPVAGIVLLAMAAGGGIGNFYDRAARGDEGPLSGAVVDMIAVDWFAVFNVADIFTVCGIIGGAALIVLWRKPAGQERDEERVGLG